MLTNAKAIGAGAFSVGIVLGAFGSHALKARLDPSDLQIFETAVRYWIYHSLALMAMGEKLLPLQLKLSVAGAIIFSGSLIALVLTDLRWLGAVTPIGGLLLITTWASIAIRNSKKL